jgi:hypothetical protein
MLRMFLPSELIAVIAPALTAESVKIRAALTAVNLWSHLWELVLLAERLPRPDTTSLLINFNSGWFGKIVQY